jgi:hypothetical protein
LVVVVGLVVIDLDGSWWVLILLFGGGGACLSLMVSGVLRLLLVMGLKLAVGGGRACGDGRACLSLLGWWW